MPERAGPSEALGNWLPHLVARVPATVRSKLLGSFLAIVALLILFGLVVLQALTGVNHRAEELIQLHNKTAAFRQLQHDTTSQLHNVTAALLDPRAQTLDTALRQMHQFRYDLDRVEHVTQDEVEIFKRIQEQHSQMIEVVTRVVILIEAGKVKEALNLRLDRVVPMADALERLTNEIVNRAESSMIAKIDETSNVYASSRWVVIGFGVGSIVLALLLGLTISSSLLEPVRLMDERFGQIASGDFSRRVQVPNRDELGGLADNLNRMNEELRGLYLRLEEATRHKSEFLASVSHELRTPLNAIIGYSEMLIEDAEAEGREQVSADLGKIHASGTHLLSLINEILDLSKIEAGKMDLFLEDFDVTALINEVSATIRPLAEKNGNTLTIQADAGLGTICADPTKTRQILFNLLSNASKFTDRGTILLKAVRHSGDGGDWITISVADTGVGMSREQMARLFEPFTQVNHERGNRYDGTGLGLVITRRFCEMMGGGITVNSRPGEGTTFEVRLLADAGTVQPDVSEEAHAEDSAG